MKSPDLKECACCGIPMVAGDSADPQCEQREDASGKVVAWTLYWKCQACGFRWQHGQFAGVNNSSTGQEPA